MPAGAYCRGITRDSWKSDQNKWTAKILSLPPVITSSPSLLVPSLVAHIVSVVCAGRLLQTDLDSLELVDFPTERRQPGVI